VDSGHDTLVGTMTKKALHKCMLCEQNVLADPTKIGEHVRKKHGLTMGDYRRMVEAELGSSLKESE
jgi:hypothetical protein